MTAALSLYLSTVAAWAGIVVAVGVLVWALNGLYRLTMYGWHQWRLRNRAASRSSSVSGFGAGVSDPPPVDGRGAGTTANTSAEIYDWANEGRLT